jgi:arsenate reductase
MSQALFEMAADGKHEARSAGTAPADHLHPIVVMAMTEIGVELDDRVPRVLTNELAQWADVVVTMGCGDACPVIHGKRYIDWELQDPKNLPIDKVREIRDDIKQRVGDLVESLNRKSH